jgi:hypothetical protein
MQKENPVAPAAVRIRSPCSVYLPAIVLAALEEVRREAVAWEAWEPHERRIARGNLRATNLGLAGSCPAEDGLAKQSSTDR